MALNRSNRYPGRFAATSLAHPQGAFKNRTSATAKDGSYLEADWLNDMSALQEAILAQAGVVPNGNVDSATSSQVFNALQTLFPVSGRQIGLPIVMTSTGSYTPSSALVKFAEVELYAAGGGGAGVPAYTNSTAAVGAGGGAGSWAKVRIPVALLSSGILVTLGSAGAAGLSGGGTGGDAGVATFGSLVSCPGGLGAGFSITTAAINAGPPAQSASPTISASIQTICSSRGGQGLPGYLVTTSTGTAGAGGSGPVGMGGGTNGTGLKGNDGAGNGSGGGGSRAMVGDTTAKAGGAGAPALCIIREFS